MAVKSIEMSSAMKLGLGPALINAPAAIAQSSVLDLAAVALAPEWIPVAFGPLYQIVHSLVLKKGCYDISSVTRKIVLVVGAAASLRLAWQWVRPMVMEQLTSSMTLTGDHHLAEHIMVWMAKNGGEKATQHVELASNAPKKEAILSSMFNSAPDNFQYEKKRKKNPAIKTAIKSCWFWYKGKPIRFEYIEREGKANLQRQPFQQEACPNSIHLSTLRCFGDLLSEFVDNVAKEERGVDMTTVYLNPSYDGHFARKQQPTRPLSTIDLDQDLKKDLVADMSRFLSPSREAYYSARGIPYRRGYLFHGPPGTGKSSTSKALAGHFNADLYIINLADVRSDATLRTLFDRASKGDIVLLEDIDSANISRENMHQASNSLDGPPAPGVSLSGLLNILDGATAKDGIILIMTSNAPESLDKALVRPGRIDKQVLFGNVSKPVAASIFSRMYRDNDDVDAGADARVHDLANAFAECVPEDTLTPAEVQGYFISNEDPVEAARGAGRWVQEMVEAKVGGRNVVGEKGVRMGEVEVEAGDSGYASSESGMASRDDDGGVGL